MSQQAVSADIIPNSDVGIFSPETEGTRKDKSSWGSDKVVGYHANLEAYICPLSNFKIQQKLR
jgi:hypothetical protein